MNARLSDPLVLPCGLSLPNRIVKAAMTEGLATPSNKATPELAALYKRWSEGGSGALITGNVLVDRRYLEAAGNVVIDGKQDEEALDGLRAMAEAAKSAGSRVIMQISHAGRQTPMAVCERPVAPSAVPLEMPGRSIAPFGHPRALTTDEVSEVVERFVHAVKIAEQTGFDGVQIHAAHGYLISQFLSPKTNQRVDQWGGTLENRARLLMEIIRQSRQQVSKAFAVGVKLNSADFQHGGFTHEDCLDVVDWLNTVDVDFIEISGGNYEQPQMMGSDIGTAPEDDGRLAASTKAREAYFVEYAKSVSARSKAPVMATGGFRSKDAMEAALSTGMVDLIGLARPLCAEPDLPAGLLNGECNAAIDHVGSKKLGPTSLLGPSSPFKLIKAMNVWAKQAWYMSQIERIAKGHSPKPSLGLFAALGEMQTAQKRTTAAYKKDMEGQVSS